MPMTSSSTGDRAPARLVPPDFLPDGTWAALAQDAIPSRGDLHSQVPSPDACPADAELRNTLSDVYNRFAFAADVTWNTQDKAREFTRNATFFSPVYGKRLVVGREAIHTGFAAITQSLGGEEACRERWTTQPATRFHHLWLSPIFDCLTPDYVRTYAKGVILGPPMGKGGPTGDAVLHPARLYVIDFAHEAGAWKMHLYFVD